MFGDIGYEGANSGIILFSEVTKGDDGGGNDGARDKPRCNLILGNCSHK